MEQNFDKLTLEDKHVFLIKNILDDDFFAEVHDTFRQKYKKYVKHIDTKRDEIEFIKTYKKYFDEYTKTLNECAVNQSRVNKVY
jgi:hypothetical protein